MVSVVIPCLNEAENLIVIYEKITKIIDHYEIIFVDNKSTDNSLQIYKHLASVDPKVKIIMMSRNFGSPQTSYMAGIRNSSGEAVVLLDGDLQDPPEVIPKMIQKWKSGYSVVYGVRTKRDETFTRKVGYFFFYRIFRYLSFLDIPLDAGEFCLIDRRVANEMSKFKEKDILIRGIRAWVGFKSTGIEYERPIRKSGKSTFSLFGYFKAAKTAIVNFTHKPLEMISYSALGLVFSTVFFGLYGLAFFIKNYTLPNKYFFTLGALAAITIPMICLGVIAEYLIIIFKEVKQRPEYIVEKTITADNISNHQSKQKFNCDKKHI